MPALGRCLGNALRAGEAADYRTAVVFTPGGPMTAARYVHSPNSREP